MEQKINLRGDRYNLKWNSFSKNLIDVIQEKQLHEALTDVTIFCEGHFIKAHKIILAASSVIFEEMFRYHQEKHPYVVLNGVSIKDLKYIMEFMYNGEIKVYDCDLQGVLTLGENWQIKGLSSVKVKDNNASTDNIVYSENTTRNSSVTNLPATDNIVNNLGNNLNAVENNIASGKNVDVKTEQSDQPIQIKYIDKDYLEQIAKGLVKWKNVDEETQRKIEKSHQDKITSNENIPPKKRKIIQEITDLIEIEEKPTKTDMDHKITPENKPVSPVIEKNTQTTRPKSPHECDHPYFIHDGLQQKKPKKIASKIGVKVEKISMDNHLSTYRVDIPGKIPRPPNAFMIFANEWRKKLAAENPNESNKSISIKLGNMWKALSSKDKEIYYAQAKKADEVHKTKYPNYYYSPKEARIRKAATFLGKGIVTDKTMELVNFMVNETKNDNHIEIEVQDEEEIVETIDVTEEPAEIPVIQEDNT